jgi:hypothetical protein
MSGSGADRLEEAHEQGKAERKRPVVMSESGSDQW